MKNISHLLKTKRFSPLFITQFFGAFNDNAFKNALLIWFTYDVAIKTGLNAPLFVTLAAGLFILPFLLFSATAGQVADKYEKSRITQMIKLVEIILMVTCAICFYLQSIYSLLTILFFMGVQSTFFGPIKYSLLPEHLKEDELISGNGLIEGGTFLSILLGTIFGGLIIRTEYGVAWLSFFVISLAIVGWLSSRFIPKSTIGDANLKVGWNIIAETWKILGHAREERTVWFSIIGISWFWLIGATLLVQFPTYTKEFIRGNEIIVTLFLTIFSIGIALGSLWCNKLLKGEINGRLVPYGSIGMTIAIIAFVIFSKLYVHDFAHYATQNAFPITQSEPLLGFTQFLSVSIYSWLILLSLLVISVFAGLFIVPLYAIMQYLSDDHYLARIIAANNVLNAFFMVMSSVLAILFVTLNFNVLDLFLFVGLINIPVYFVIRGVVKRRLKDV